ncbi:hypothetical protein AGR8A_Cc30616 [Agrobacterium fabrum str. J-07]|nr:hypothetical protein AGR8A_Cc30616 [Agrobacterium fabrum str. J-07]
MNLKESRLIEAAIIAASGDQPIRMRWVRFFMREQLENIFDNVNFQQRLRRKYKTKAIQKVVV